MSQKLYAVGQAHLCRYAVPDTVTRRADCCGKTLFSMFYTADFTYFRWSKSRVETRSNLNIKPRFCGINRCCAYARSLAGCVIIKFMLEELLKLTETLDYEENGGICVVGAAWQNDKADLKILIEVNTGGDDALQNWSLICWSERENKLKLGCGNYLDVTDDHILLWPHIKPHFSLWFSGSTPSPPAVVGELLQAHQKLVGKWLPFSQFINYSHDLEGIIAGGHGKLAEGPEPLISVYQHIIHRHGFKTSRPLLYGEGKPAVEPGKIIVLIVVDSYVVATAVEACRTD